MWPEDDHMEIGERGWIPVGDGFIEKTTGKWIDPDDLVYEDDEEEDDTDPEPQ